MMNSNFDRRQLQHALKLDRAWVDELVTLFTQLQPSMIARLDTAIANGDCAEIYEAMHILKSRLRNLCCPRLGDRAESIERMAKENQLDAIKEAYVQLRIDMDDAVAGIRAFLAEENH